MNNALTNKLTLSLKDAGILVVFLALVATLWAVSPDHQFLSLNNILLILIQTAINGILAMGMMYVIISGEIDLSVGSTIALSGVTAAMLAHPGQFPLIVPIEFLSTFILRPLTLTVRLMANMISGHLLLALCFVATNALFVYASASLKALGAITLAAGVAFIVFEAFVAALQAYIFTLLTAVYIDSSVRMH